MEWKGEQAEVTKSLRLCSWAHIE